MTGFRPSEHGFGFTNDWPAGPAVRLGRLGVGDASKGLCGGMVYATRDYLAAGRVPPDEQPVAGSPVFRFIVRRLVASWRLPLGVTRYYRWMALGDAAVAGRTVAGLDRIRTELDAGRPCCLGVVTTHSINPARLGDNHQVLAYGYDVAGDAVTLRIYDPNRGRDNDVRITVDGRNPVDFRHNLAISHPVRGFFRVGYRPATPPA
jgi:hypothetical protein